MKKLSVAEFMIAVAAATLLVTTGCSTMKRGGETEGEILEAGDDFPMTGERFDAMYPRVEGVTFQPVYFGYDNYQIPAGEQTKIDAVIEFLRTNGGVVIVVEGHCDDRGTNEYNMSLGEYRAQSIRAYIINAGISANRIQTASFGEERPAVAGSGESAWKMNRRGEFVAFKAR